MPNWRANMKIKMKIIPPAAAVCYYAGALDIVGARRELAIVRRIHCHLIQLSLSSHRFLSPKILAAYARCGRLVESQHLLDRFTSLHLRLPPLFSLNALLSLTQGGGLLLLRSMLSCGPFPNPVSITTLLKCSSSLAVTKLLHSLSLSSGLLPSPLLFPSLISSYSSCADFSSARQLFDEIPPQCSTISAQTAFMSACATHGLAQEVVRMFEKEVKTEEADDMAVTAVLAACAREGLVQEGERVFRTVKKPVMHHYTCMVELYGKAGRVEEAEWLIQEMGEEPDEVLWNALLSVCQVHGRLDVVNHVANWFRDYAAKLAT